MHVVLSIAETVAVNCGGRGMAVMMRITVVIMWRSERN